MKFETIIKQRLWIIGLLLMIGGFFFASYPLGLITDLLKSVLEYFKYDVTFVDSIFDSLKPYFLRWFVSGLSIMYAGFLLAVIPLINAEEKPIYKKNNYAKKIKIVLAIALVINIMMISYILWNTYIAYPAVPTLSGSPIIQPTLMIQTFPTIPSILFNSLILTENEIFLAIMLTFGIFVLSVLFEELDITDYLVDKPTNPEINENKKRQMNKKPI